MTVSFRWKVATISVALSFGLAIPALAQSNDSAAQSMKAAGDSIQNVGSDTTKAAEHAYHDAATVVRDTKITAKVKTALREDSATEHSDIHVSTSAGLVTLEGEVDSPTVGVRAEQVARNTEDVKEVNNQLKVSGAEISD
jgi:hyperosmotically inducible periplasmic protein